MSVDATHGHAAREVGRRAVGGVEARHPDDDRLAGGLEQGELGVDVAEVEVPLPHAGLAVAVTQRAVRDDGLAGPRVDEHGLEGGVLLARVVGEVGGGEELAGRVLAVAGLLEPDEVGQVGVGLHVLGEVRRRAVDEELLEHDVAHRHRERRVGARPGRQPLVGELHVVGVVRRDRDHLLTAVAGLGHPVRVGCPGHREVGAPHDQVAGVPPVARLGDVGLVAEDLRGRDREVGVPVVEAQHRATDEVHEPGAGGVRHHRHRRDGREPGHPVGPVLLDRVDVRRRDDLAGLVPGGADQAALAAGGLVRLGPLGVLDDVLPRLHGVTAVLVLRLAEHLEQDATHVRVADPRRRVGVPGEGRTTRAAAGLVLRGVRSDRGVVGLLGLPGDDPVLDVDLPRAGAGAVDAVGGAHDLVVAPAVAVEVVRSSPAGLGQGPQVGRDGAPREEPPAADEGVGQRAVHPDVGPGLLGGWGQRASCPWVAVRRTTVTVSSRASAAVAQSIQSPMA